MKLCNIILIFRNNLNFSYLTIFGSVISVSNKELFQIKLTLIYNSRDYENMIALFVFSFILLFLLLAHKRDLRSKACISSIFLFFSISHFSTKKSLGLNPENTLQSITTIEIFTYEFIKACSFANMVCFNQELNLFCFSKLRYRNNKTYFRLLPLLSGDISLTPGPINGSQKYHNDQQHNSNQWGVFKKEWSSSCAF